jgi:hypothetical protein
VRVNTTSKESKLTDTTTAQYVDLNTLPTYTEVDLDNRESLLAEMTKIAAGAGEYSIRGSDRADRLGCLARVSFLASRLAWLEASDMSTAQMRTAMDSRS